SFLFVVLSEMCSVAGQLLFKQSMNSTHEQSRTKFLPTFIAGIAVMGLGFFLWLGLLSKFDLSFLYPFEGLNHIILVLAASFFLKEKMSVSLWLGVLLISAGVALVSTS